MSWPRTRNRCIGVGSSKRDFLSFPAGVKEDLGNALGVARFGGTAPTAKPWKGLGPGVLEIVESHDGNEYRAVYTVRFEKAVRGITRSTMASRNAERRESVTRGTGNVFADLGFPDAAERQAKLRLAYALNQVLEERKLSQADTAKVLGVTQPKVSALRHYKLAGFSVERLMNLLTAVDQDVEIVIRRKPRSRKAGRIVSHREFERLRGKRLHFRDAYRRFLKTHSLQDIGVDDEFADSARDRTTGRKVLL